ncbi:hypothetical protein [Streptomyces acidiscabies]|uniref:hypothetical protein n=1 Tax=Streptomyces acidiscabies TaxID=42234 RepID=UPI0038F68A8A
MHVGWDQYVYVGSNRLCEQAVGRTRELGLFPEPMTTSPYAAELEERLTPESLDAVRTGLSPRALLTVWKAQDGTIRHAVVDETEYQELAILVAGALH